MSSVAVPFTADTISIISWPDRVLDAIGHDPRSPYVERFWLPILGPSTVWLLRHLAGELERSPSGVRLDLVETARSLGLANNPGRHGPFTGALVRMVQFGAAQYLPDGLAVRRKLAFLPPRHLDRLPDRLRAEHQIWVDRDDHTTQVQLKKRAYGLALTLLRLGESAEEVSWQLGQWRFAQEVVDEALVWALGRTGASSAEHPDQPLEAA
jgi:hypothetical protein